MVSYQFQAVDYDTMKSFLQKQKDAETNTMNLMCYSLGLAGAGECRFVNQV